MGQPPHNGPTECVPCGQAGGRGGPARRDDGRDNLQRHHQRRVCASSPTCQSTPTTISPTLTAFYLVSLGFGTRFGWFWMVLPSFTGFYRVLPVFSRLHLVLLVLTGPYWVIFGVTGFYLVLLGFTGFYWALLAFIGFYLV